MAKYIDNKEFLQHVIDSKKAGQITDQLAKDFLLMAKNIINSRLFCYYREDLKEDMIQNSMLRLMKYWDKFDENKFKDPFAYYTRIIIHSYYDEYRKFDKQLKIRRALRDKLIDEAKIGNFSSNINIEDMEFDDGRNEENNA